MRSINTLIFSTFCLFFPLFSVAQSPGRTLFYDADWFLCDSVGAVYRSAWFYSDSSAGGYIESTDSSGILLSRRFFSDMQQLVRHGSAVFYHPNGTVKSAANYEYDELHGERLTYYANGQLRRREVFENGTMLEGHCYTREGKDTAWFEYEVLPTYEGGMTALYQTINKNIRYQEASKAGLGGRVVVRFVIRETGEMARLEIKESAHPMLDAEVLRVFSQLKRSWQPCLEDGEPVSYRFELPFVFRLLD